MTANGTTLLDSTKFNQWLTEVRRGAIEPVASGNQGIIWRYQTTDNDIALKGVKGGWFWRWLSQRSLVNELKAYRKLQHIDGIADCLGLLHKRFLVLSYVKGCGYRQAQWEDRDAWFNDLQVLIEQMHEAGVAHGDLKRKENLLVGEDARPWVLDFGTAVIRKQGVNPINKWMFQFCCKLDNNAVIKHKYHGDYDQVAGDDLLRLQYTLPERLWRWLRPILGVK